MKNIDWQLIYYPTIDSTNEEARRLIKEGKSEGTVIVAEQQSKGRGKPGRTWVSSPGGIYLSAILRPFKNPQALVPLTLLAARAVAQTVAKVSGLKAEIKLPNDVLIKGKKICGILVERVASGHLIVGIGLNLNNAVDSVQPATSLKQEAGKEFVPSLFIENMLSELNQEYLAYLK